nr:MMPL family transporter [Candidatus Wukongarchaeota archaeon]
MLLSQAFVFAIAIVTLKYQTLSPITTIGDQTGIFWVMPIIAVAILLGLEIDYDLFVTSRIKENVWKGIETREAIIDALQTTGTIITGLAAIMIAAFGTLLIAENIHLVQIGYLLALGVFIDATLVRTLLVPSVMSVTEKYNWWPSKPPTSQKQEK